MYNGWENDPEGQGEDSAYRKWLTEDWFKRQIAYSMRQAWHKHLLKELAMAQPRMKFIPEMKDMMVANLVKQGLTEAQIIRAFEVWEAGDSPRNPIQRGCFEVFETIQKQVDAGSA